MTVYGYARISTGHQELRMQVHALRQAGIGKPFVEKISGRLDQSRRPELMSCLHQLKAGDTVVVWRLDRLGRSLTDLLDIVSTIEAAHAQVQSLTEFIDTSTPTGRMILQMFAVLAEFERNLIRERTRAGFYNTGK